MAHFGVDTIETAAAGRLIQSGPGAVSSADVDAPGAIGIPKTPDLFAIELAKRILQGRFECSVGDLNEMLRHVRRGALPAAHVYFGPSPENAVPVIEAVADQNLSLAPMFKLRHRIAALQRRVCRSVEADRQKFDASRLGGAGAAGRVRDRHRAAEGRALLKDQIQRIASELRRREDELRNAQSAQGEENASDATA